MKLIVRWHLNKPPKRSTAQQTNRLTESQLLQSPFLKCSLIGFLIIIKKIFMVLVCKFTIRYMICKHAHIAIVVSPSPVLSSLSFLQLTSSQDQISSTQ